MSLRSPTENENGEHVFDLTTVRHSRTLLAGIQAKSGLDPRLKHSGVTIVGVAFPDPAILERRHKGARCLMGAPRTLRSPDAEERNPDFTSFVCFASFVVKTILSRHHRGTRFLISAINPLASKFCVTEVIIT
jgi:hypothetical protein